MRGMDPVRNPFAPGAGQRPPELAGRDKEVAAFEETLDGFAEAVARAGGDISVDVIKAKPRAPKQETH